jgi:hypothetical protein
VEGRATAGANGHALSSPAEALGEVGRARPALAEAPAAAGTAPTPAPAAVAPPGEPRVVVLERREDLEAYLPSWAALAERAIEPNAGWHPAGLLPALQAAGAAADVALVLVLGDPPASATRPGPPELLGLFPLERRGAGTDMVVSRLRMWTGDHARVPVPLLDRTRAGEALRAFFDWLERQRRALPLLEIDGLPAGGAFHGLLLEEVRRRRAHVLVGDRGIDAAGGGEVSSGDRSGERRPLQRWLITPDRTLGLALSLASLSRWLRRTFRALARR